MISFRDTIKDIPHIPRHLLGRCMLLLELCKDAKKTEDPSKRQYVGDYIQLACQYVCTVANHHNKEVREPPEILWELVKQKLKHLCEDNILPSEVLSRLWNMIEEDGYAEKQLRRAFERVAKSENKGGTTLVQLFILEKSGEIDQSVYKVRAQTSSQILAAIAIFSGYLENISNVLNMGRSLDFYAPWDSSETSMVKPWIDGKIPKQLFAVVDKGRFEFQIPRLFPNIYASKWVFRNIFKYMDNTVYLKESTGTLYPVKAIDADQTVGCQKVTYIHDVGYMLVPCHTWTQVFDQIQKAEEDDWIVQGPIAV